MAHLLKHVWKISAPTYKALSTMETYMKNMKLVIVLCLLFSASAYGGEKHDLVLEMLEITNAQQNHELMIEAYVKQLAANPVTAAPEFEEYFREAIAWDALIEPITKIYEDAYTVKELKALNEFFSSPSGKSFIAKTPEVNEKTTVVLMRNIQKASQHLAPSE